MDFEETMAGMFLAFVGFMTFFLLTMALTTPEMRDVEVCETTVTETGSVERCWNTQEVVE